MNEEKNEFTESFSEGGFWEKLGNFALKAGREVVEKALTLYYTLKDDDTPGLAKAKIIAALGYFISPVDAIPDVAPLVGFSDDLGVLALAMVSVLMHVKKEHKEQAKERLGEWFGGGDLETE